MFLWNPVAVPALLAILLLLAMGVRIYTAGPGQGLNRWLAAVMVLEAVGMAGQHGVLLLATEEAARWWLNATIVPAFLWPILYLQVVASLDSPWTRPLRSLPARLLIAGWVVALVGTMATSPEVFITVAPAGPGWELVGGPGLKVAYLVVMFLFIFSLAVSISAYRRAKGDLQRRRARAFVHSFGFRDAVLFPWLFVVALFLPQPPQEPAHIALYHLVPAATEVTATAILLVGILRTQLFDIDLRVRRTIKHGTVAAVLLAGYAAITLAAEDVVPPTSTRYLGLVAAALLILAVVPLQRLADRVALTAVPDPSGPADALNLRRIDLYHGALETAVTGDDLTTRRSAMLARMRKDLGVTEHDHHVLLHLLRQGKARGPPDDTLAPGSLFLSRFRVLRSLGVGGAGVTYLCRDEQLGREVVLKRVLSPTKDPQGMRLLLREARAMAVLRHHHVLTIHDLQQLGPELVLVMEYAEGGSLAARLQRGPVVGADFRRLAEDLLSGLQAVHEAGLVHRDVKPSNILLTRSGEAKLGDFGIAHLPGFDDTLAVVTGQPSAVGTVPYMSPEQARGWNTDARTDIYSAGATLFEAWSGRPYRARQGSESAVELQLRVASDREVDPNLEVPPRLRSWFARALDPLPSRRFPSVAAMRKDLLDAWDTPADAPDPWSGPPSPAAAGAP